MDQLYSSLMEEEDTRVCKDIPESACSNVPQNFFRQVAAATLTTLGDTLTNPKTTLAWLMGIVGAPVALVAWLVPIRESGSMLPQLFISAYIRQPDTGGFVIGHGPGCLAHQRPAGRAIDPRLSGRIQPGARTLLGCQQGCDRQDRAQDPPRAHEWPGQQSFWLAGTGFRRVLPDLAAGR